MGAGIADGSYRDPYRLPGLSDSGHALLLRMINHPMAPRYRNRSGHKLTPAELQQAVAFEKQVAATPPGHLPDAYPGWLQEFIEKSCRWVPAYKPLRGKPFQELPTWTRADLSHSVERYVPDTVDVSRLILFSTSGTTGHPLVVPSLPLVASRYLAFYLAALREIGIEPARGADHVGILLAGYQEKCFTYVSVNPTLGESGLAKLNLHPNDWRSESHRGPYLDDMAPEVISGDPISLAELARVGMQHKPRAIISTSMVLLPAQREYLETCFACPLLDIYSMNEAGPIAVYDTARQGYRLLQPWLHVETLDASGQAVAPGEVGEITITGGFNDCLPLLRYRTGDYGILAMSADGRPLLRALQGRPPVRFRTPQGHWLNNLEITHALKHCALAQYALHQDASGQLILRIFGPSAGMALARIALHTLFGPRQPLRIEHLPLPTAKVIQYTSDLAGSGPL